MENSEGADGELGIFNESRSRNIRPSFGRTGERECWDSADHGGRDGAAKDGKETGCFPLHGRYSNKTSLCSFNRVHFQ